MNKNEIINEYSKGDFTRFLESDYEGKILELFSGDGIELLSRSGIKEDRIAYTLTYSKYANELFSNLEFLKVFLESDISYYYGSLRSLKKETYDKIIKGAIGLKVENRLIVDLLLYFDSEYLLEFIEQPNLPQEIVVSILKKTTNIQVINKIISNYNIDLVEDNINIQNFFLEAKSSVLDAYKRRNRYGEESDVIEIPNTMINDKLARKIFEDNDIFMARKIITTAEHSCNVEVLNNYVKSREDDIICNQDIIFEIKELDELIRGYKEKKIALEENYDYDLRMEVIRMGRELEKKLIKFFGKNIDVDDFIEDDYLSKMEDLNNKMLSNYIIDYHFEENYFNIMLDMNELMHFYYDGNVVLDEEHVDLYREILNIDFLSVEEKRELHNRLKNYDIMSMFYDDMLTARRVVNEAIKDSSLSKETIGKYRDEELSNKYGVDVYLMDGEPFFGIVKTGVHTNDDLPTGHSFSLVGPGGMATYGDPREGTTYLYDAGEMNPDQIVHVYPFDSFTLYRPFDNVDEATTRVNTLAMPQEVVEVSTSYDEILILEQGNMDTPIDDSIPKLTRIALYCMDNIREEDVIKAKNSGVGIILVSASKYKDRESLPLFSYRMNIDQWEYNYFNGSYEREKFEATR